MNFENRYTDVTAADELRLTDYLQANVGNWRLIATITLAVTMFVRVMKTEFASVRNEFTSVRNEFASVRREMALGFEAVRTEFRAVHGRIDAIDRDVNAIYRHLFGIDRS